VGRSTIVVFGNKNWRCSVNGTTNAYLKVRNYKVSSGREFTDEDERTSKSVCLLGATTKNELFGKQDPVGQLLRVGKMPCEVIGTLGSKGEGGAGTDQDDVVLMPLSAYQRKISGNHDVSNIYVSVEEARPTSMVKAQLEGLMRERRKIAPGAADDFSVRDMQEVASAMVGATSALTALLGAIAAVSLLVERHRHHEHHARVVSERTARDRHPAHPIARDRNRGALAQFLVEGGDAHLRSA
jgi:putative ABC transport system permease protein